MAEIDASIATKAVPPTFDGVKTVTGLQALQQGMLQNRLLGQQVQGREALGRAVTAATDATTGTTDWKRALAGLAGDPHGAFQVPELAGQVLDREQKQTTLDSSQLELSAARWKRVGDVSGTLLAEREPLTREGVIKTLSDQLVSSGMFSDEHSVGMLTNFVQNLPKDDAGIRTALKNAYLTSNMTAERIATLMGTPASVDNGSEIIQQQQSPLTGETKVNAVIDKTRSPSEKAAMVQTWDPATKSYVLKPSGAIVGDMAPGAVPGQGAQPQSVQSAPALGEPETASANVQQAQVLQQRAAIVPQRRAALKNMVDAVADFTPGPKADLTYAVGALATMAGKAAPSTVRGVAAQEEFNKLAAQVALDQWGALGGSGSNEQLATAMKANPNTALSRMGIKNVAALLQGNEDAIGAQFDAWKKYSAVHGASSYGDFLQGWNRYYDPRVFQAQHMDPGSLKSMLAKMSPEERKTFNRDQGIAKQAGWLGQ